MTTQEFWNQWNEVTGFDGFKAQTETPETMNFDEFSSNDNFKYENDDSYFVKAYDEENENWNLFEMNKETEKVQQY